MLKPVTHITITQRGRSQNKMLFFDFVNHWEVADGWENMTTNGKIIFPKNVYFRDLQTGRLFPMMGQNKSINDTFKKGDKVEIASYYIYWDKNGNEKKTKTKKNFDGYITNVKSGVPIELDLEDSMFLLKQIPLKNQVYANGTTIESILKDALVGSGLTVNMLTKTTLKYDNALLTAENETVAQFLAKLRKDAFLFAYFRGTELRCGSYVYIESEAKEYNFEFQNNIIESDFNYNDKKDIVLSAAASNHIQEKTGQITKDGQEKTKNTRLEVLVTLKNDKVTVKVIKKGDKAEPNTDGERRTFTFLEAKTTDQLAELAEAQLRKYYYTGFKGTFTTFGTPVVQFGDNVNIINQLLPEQNGLYKVKAVSSEGGVGGMRQKIELDYKIK